MGDIIKAIVIVGLLIAVVAGVIIMSFGYSIIGNKQFVDLNYKYTKAIIAIGDKTIEVDVDKWNDYDGEQLQIVATDGTVYLVSSFNTILKSK